MHFDRFIIKVKGVRIKEVTLFKQIYLRQYPTLWGGFFSIGEEVLLLLRRYIECLP